MALWLVRAGSHGEYEKKFLDDGRVYLTWNGLSRDLKLADTKAGLRDLLTEVYPSSSEKKLINHAGQIWAFSHRIEPGAWVVLPSKHKAAIHIGEVKGTYQFDPKAQNPFYHWLEVDWAHQDIPRTAFDQDILYSFGAFLTICQIKRNDAEERIRSLAKRNWVPDHSLRVKELEKKDDEDTDGETLDLEQIAKDQIAKYILAKFKGHGMARLVDAVLRAQGYTTLVSPPGPDKGIDILAAPGALGFGQPRLCVQVKSSETALDRPTLDQLIGVMQNVQAEQGLLVSWGGFKSSVDKEKASQFFRVRLWDQDDLIQQLMTHYDKIDDELRAELPLKRIWTIAEPEEEY